MERSELKRHIERRLAALEEERASWEPHWRDLAAHFLPHRTRFLNAGDRTNEGDRRNTRLFDATGRLAVRTLASGMQAGLTSPARPWFQLALHNEELAQRDGSKFWLHDAHARMMAVFRASNFYEQIHTLYGELAVFGTACMLVEEDMDAVARFKTLTAGEYALDTDASGRVNALYRRIVMTPEQIRSGWPGTCPDEIKDKADNSSREWIEILHAVEPNTNGREGRLDGKNRPWLSVYMLGSGQKTILEESGYYEFPALCPRWETTGNDIYGRSPAMDALPDCRMLQRMAKDGIEALELEISPPLNVLTGGNEPVDISPRAVNYLPPSAAGQQAVSPLYQVRANLQALEAAKSATRGQIREALFNNLFMMLAGIDKSMTATEVAERNAEKMLMLGPVLDRMRSELFQPLIDRVGGIMDRKGLLAVPPDYLQGESLAIEFVSILAQAQKQAGISAIHQMAGFVGQMAKLAPSALDKFDPDEAVDEIAAMLGVPPRLIRSDDSVAGLRAARDQANSQAIEADALRQGVALAKDGAEAMGKAGINAGMLFDALGEGGE